MRFLYSRTVAGAWIALQLELRADLGVSIDYKAAQTEGEGQIT
jgi:hypothetical protein